MKCPECNGRGETIYYVETHRDKNIVTIEQRNGICRTCNGSGEKPMTNADRIRAMTDEELAMLLARFEYDVGKQICAKFGVDITIIEHDFEAAAKEHLQRLQQPAEGD